VAHQKWFLYILYWKLAIRIRNCFEILNLKPQKCQSQCPRGLRRRSTATRLLRLWIRIPPETWMSVCCECCVLSGRGLCDELITRPGEAYWLWFVVVCVLETSWMRRPWPIGGLLLQIKKTPKIIQCQAKFRVLLSMWLKCSFFSGFEVFGGVRLLLFRSNFTYFDTWKAYFQNLQYPFATAVGHIYRRLRDKYMYEGKQKLRNLQVRVYAAFACSSCTQLAHLRPASCKFFHR